MKYQNDIDKMNTNRNLFLMSLPIFVELLLQLLVGNVDQMMVSRVSQPSVAAIVNANQIMNLVIIVLSMASTAVTVILSQYLGAQDEKNASRTCMVSIVLIGGVSLAATILVFAGHTPLYRAIHVPEEVFDDRSMGFGYRAPYLKEIYEYGANNPDWLDNLRKMSYDEAMESLLTRKGIGKKVANCICLFGLHHVDAFPIDTHVKQLLDKYYSDGFDFERYKGVAGIIQQYLFYFEL